MNYYRLSFEGRSAKRLLLGFLCVCLGWKRSSMLDMCIGLLESNAKQTSREICRNEHTFRMDSR